MAVQPLHHHAITEQTLLTAAITTAAKYVSFVRSKVKVKLSMCFTKYHYVKIYWRSGGIAPRFLTSELDGGQLYTPAALSPGKDHSLLPVPIGWEGGGPQSRSGSGGE
jgi:hypothetical protein